LFDLVALVSLLIESESEEAASADRRSTVFHQPPNSPVNHIRQAQENRKREQQVKHDLQHHCDHRSEDDLRKTHASDSTPCRRLTSGRIPR